MVAAAVSIWTLCLIYSVTLLWMGRFTRMDDGSWTSAAVAALGGPFNSFVLAAVGLLAVGAAMLEGRLGHASEFPAGLLTGMAAVLATLVLAAVVLLWGSTEDWHTTVLIVFVAHMPIAVIEGVILGFVVGFLARVKPEMLAGRSQPLAPVVANGAITNAAAGRRRIRRAEIARACRRRLAPPCPALPRRSRRIVGGDARPRSSARGGLSRAVGRPGPGRELVLRRRQGAGGGQDSGVPRRMATC